MLRDPAAGARCICTCETSHLTEPVLVFCAGEKEKREVADAVTKEQKKATRKALRQYAAGPVCAAWAEVIEGVLRHYEALEPLCAQLLRLRYLEGRTEDEVVPALYVSRSTYYRKELEVLSTVAVEAARRGLL